MATIKKETAAKPATKVAAKPAAKPAAKAAAKPAAKKPAAKSTAKAGAKPAAKKPAAKSTAKAGAKPAAKKPAAKSTAKAGAKPAAKKPAAKAGAKPAAKKPAAKAGSKPSAAKKSSKKEEVSNVPFRNLFEAYAQGKLPFNHGYIVSSFFSDKSYYSKYEIVSYAGVKEIFPTAEGLTFVTGGKKLHVLLEPDTYNKKFQEPVSRSDDERIPKRFAELETVTASNQSKIMIAKEPDESYGSFTILKPTGINFSMVFYQTPKLYDALTAFFQDSFNRFRRVPAIDAKKAAQLITATIKKSMGFEGEYS